MTKIALLALTLALTACAPAVVHPAPAPQPPVQAPAPTPAPAPQPPAETPAPATEDICVDLSRDAEPGVLVQVREAYAVTGSFVRHIRADDSYGGDLAGREGVLLHAGRPAARARVEPGSVIEVSCDGTRNWRVRARY